LVPAAPNGAPRYRMGAGAARCPEAPAGTHWYQRHHLVPAVPSGAARYRSVRVPPRHRGVRDGTRGAVWRLWVAYGTGTDPVPVGAVGYPWYQAVPSVTGGTALVPYCAGCAGCGRLSVYRLDLHLSSPITFNANLSRPATYVIVQLCMFSCFGLLYM
jgi:hypothetical protein